MTRRQSAFVAVFLAGTAISLPARAQDHSQDTAGAHHADPHGEQADDDASQDIVVSGHLPSDSGLLASTVSLKGDDLVADMRGQIGETLAHLPGVSATSFAPGASRPVLRGLDGDRVRVLVDGIGSIDASNVSADHAVVFDPLTVDHIDVVHGPAVLLFGGQAIGGAVNALDKRIPRSVPDTASATFIGSYGTAAKEKSVAGAADLALADRLVAHIDANWRKSDDLGVGGYVNSAPLRGELLSDAAEQREAGQNDQADELERLAGLRGHIPNTAARSYTLGAGLAFIDDGGNLGISVQHFDTHYGIPMRPGSAEEAPVSIDLVQTRVDMRGAVNLNGFLDSLQFRGAYGDYRHVELEGDEAGTKFAGEGVEFRTDLVQSDNNGWKGRSGVQLVARTLSVVGAEAFVPDNAVSRLSVFTLQSLGLGSGLELEAAGRYETAGVKAVSVGFDRNFDLWSGALGVSWVPSEGWKVGANYIRGARAPAPEELLSNGMHAATQSFEIGDPNFRKETSDGFEAYVRYDGEGHSVSLTGYVTDFDGFITALPTGAEQEGLPVYQYQQLPARFKGFEASGSIDAFHWNGGVLKLDASADYTHAQLKNVGPVPRIPALRLQGGVEAETGPLHLRGEVEWNDDQPRVSALEYPVKSFTVVNLSADWHPMGEDAPVTLILDANNIFDVVGRRAASYTRDFVPIAGRDIRLTAKLSF
jgi:iron complex outermembrane receptor protein